jgi:hypothetical protein
MFQAFAQDGAARQAASAMSRKATYWMHHDGGRYLTGGSARALTLALDTAQALSLGRIKVDSWWRYRMDLERVPPLAQSVELQPVTDELIEQLRRHQDKDANQLISGFRFWDAGFRNALVWMWHDEPLVIEWLLFPEDNQRLLELPEWGGIHMPMVPGEARMENLFKFRTREKPPQDVAALFQQAVFLHTRRLGVHWLYSHIGSENKRAIALTERTDRERCGWIRRYTFDLPRLRDKPLYVHRAEAVPEPKLRPVYRSA